MLRSIAILIDQIKLQLVNGGRSQGRFFSAIKQNWVTLTKSHVVEYLEGRGGNKGHSETGTKMDKGT